MTIDIYTLNYTDLLTVAGAAAVCVVLTQWLKQYLPDWRFTNLLALALTTVLAEIAAALSGPFSAQSAFAAFVTALAGASLATFGYETIINLLGFAGMGPRK
jgi:glucan phosphoethanolaminetransferase (alkaline phosphatase superfamily)